MIIIDTRFFFVPTNIGNQLSYTSHLKHILNVVFLFC